MPNKGGGDPKMNMPRFNMNWIYAIAIAALALLYIRRWPFEQQCR